MPNCSIYRRRRIDDASGRIYALVSADFATDLYIFEHVIGYNVAALWSHDMCLIGLSHSHNSAYLPVQFIPSFL